MIVLCFLLLSGFGGVFLGGGGGKGLWKVLNNCVRKLLFCWM